MCYSLRHTEYFNRGSVLPVMTTDGTLFLSLHRRRKLDNIGDMAGSK